MCAVGQDFTIAMRSNSRPLRSSLRTTTRCTTCGHRTVTEETTVHPIARAVRRALEAVRHRDQQTGARPETRPARPQPNGGHPA